jgi:hypothetical protein
MRPSKLFSSFSGFFLPPLIILSFELGRAGDCVFSEINVWWQLGFKGGGGLCVVRCCEDEQFTRLTALTGKWVVAVVVGNHHPPCHGDVTRRRRRRRRTSSTKARPSVRPYDPPKPIPHVVVGKSTTTTNRYRPRFIARALRTQTAMMIIINNSTIITNNMLRRCVAFESQVQQTPAPRT